MIDSHCHLDCLKDNVGISSVEAPSPERRLQVAERALSEARMRGVKGFLCIGLGVESASLLQPWALNHDDVWLTVGVHPLADRLDFDYEQLMSWGQKSDIVAIGETGLDYHYSPDSRERQLAAFQKHLDIASQVDKPIIVHTRSAEQDTLEMLNRYKGKVTGVLHCFTESWDMAKAALDLGFYISISGIVTFKNAHNVRDVARKIPANRLLIETDSPYLAPVPYRGKPNQPAFLPEVADCLARLRAVTLDQLVTQTTGNFHRLFSRTQKHADCAA